MGRNSRRRKARRISGAPPARKARSHQPRQRQTRSSQEAFRISQADLVQGMQELKQPGVLENDLNMIARFYGFSLDWVTEAAVKIRQMWAAGGDL